MPQPVIAVVGPTASGKTTLSLGLASALSGEIIVMDSMQIYRGMDIGTAKPTRDEQAIAKHHLLDIVSPSEPFSVSDYACLARQVMNDIASRGNIPILVGGTGFYLKALMYGLALGGAKGDETIRASLEQEAQEPHGKEKLHQRLAQVDPETAARLHVNDVRRVVRALEVWQVTGVPFSRQEQPPPDGRYQYLILGCDYPREVLYRRINERVEQMMARGLLDEVRALLQSGVSARSQAMQGIGYKELVPVAQCGAPLDDAVRLIQQNTRHYAKRQLTWFRAEKQVHWLDMSRPSAAEEADVMAQKWLNEQRREQA